MPSAQRSAAGRWRARAEPGAAEESPLAPPGSVTRGGEDACAYCVCDDGSCGGACRACGTGDGQLRSYRRLSGACALGPQLPWAQLRSGSRPNHPHRSPVNGCPSLSTSGGEPRVDIVTRLNRKRQWLGRSSTRATRSAEPAVQIRGGADQRQVGEGLREVAQLFAGRADLLGV
jgi:hypothetical protein